MNAVERTALLRHRDSIVQCVDLLYIKDILISTKVINNEEWEEIDYEVNKDNMTSFVFFLNLHLNLFSENKICEGSEAARLSAQKRSPNLPHISDNPRKRL